MLLRRVGVVRDLAIYYKLYYVDITLHTLKKLLKGVPFTQCDNIRPS